MIAFIPLSLPAAWVIDTRGFRIAVGFGVVMMGVFGITRGLAGPNYALALASTIGIAIAQPFLLDSWTKVPANWFPAGERATAVGLITLASMLGVAAGMGLSRLPGRRHVDRDDAAGLRPRRGGVARSRSCCWRASVRPRRRTRPAWRCGPSCSTGSSTRSPSSRSWSCSAVAFVIMGVFNGVTSWVGDIILPRGFGSTDAAILGAVMLVVGVIGAVVLGAISDRQGKRVRYLALALALAVPCLVGVAFVSTLWLLYAASALLGFFIVGALPIGMQYAAEVTHPRRRARPTGSSSCSGSARWPSSGSWACCAPATARSRCRWCWPACSSP